MRISTLLLFLFGLLMAGVAPARGQVTESSRTPSNIASLKFDPAIADDLAIDQYRLPEQWNESLAIGDIEPARDQVCYTMRSYKVERTERVDESTQPMKYSTCSPSSRFEVRDADVYVVQPEGPQP